METELQPSRQADRQGKGEQTEVDIETEAETDRETETEATAKVTHAPSQLKVASVIAYLFC